MSLLESEPFCYLQNGEWGKSEGSCERFSWWWVIKRGLVTILHTQTHAHAHTHLYTALTRATLGNCDSKPERQLTYSKAYTHYMSPGIDWLGTNPAEAHFQRKGIRCLVGSSWCRSQFEVFPPSGALKGLEGISHSLLLWAAYGFVSTVSFVCSITSCVSTTTKPKYRK